MKRGSRNDFYSEGMKHVHVALPDTEYLIRIGEIAYAVSSLEWTLIGDLYQYGGDLPDSLLPSQLEPSTTGNIGEKASNAAKNMQPGPLRDYVEACGQALDEVAEIRNDILHARPATHPDQGQRLHRAGVKREGRKPVLDGRRFWIDDDYLEEQIDRLNELSRMVHDKRALVQDETESAE